MACNKKRLRVSLPATLGHKFGLQSLNHFPLHRQVCARPSPRPFHTLGPRPRPSLHEPETPRFRPRQVRLRLLHRACAGTGERRRRRGGRCPAGPPLPGFSDFSRAWSRPLVTLPGPGGRVAGEARGLGHRQGSGRPYLPPPAPVPRGRLPGVPLGGLLSGRISPPACTPQPAPGPSWRAGPCPPRLCACVFAVGPSGGVAAPRTLRGREGRRSRSQLWRSAAGLARWAQLAPRFSYPVCS